ncbi:hypothetical protein OOT55_07450 [Marinimicrobium sp. C6131]|uniref:protein YgfX n=1 Tax=Marinimicrobium sp. C6131 TaxID=3022676 RepID=UPI00223D2CB3|nr:protein YgfX [Marinimicrobium sp. C6131]UZJ45877.1 hypothetical protein OOT55_07450 [Marinimicrobium sp. C6131]
MAPIHLQPSLWLQRLHRCLLLTLAVLPWLAFVGHSGVPAGWIIVLCLFNALLAWEWCRSGRRSGPTVLSYEAGEWTLGWQSGVVTVAPFGEWLIWPWLQLVRFREVDGRAVHTLVILPDSASADDRRRLRVWLRMGRWHQRH